MMKSDEQEMSQIEQIWYQRSVEVHSFVDPNPETYWKERLPKFKDEIMRADGCVCLEGEKIEGFITFTKRKGCMYISELFARESGKGIGPRLLDKAKELAHPYPLIVHVYAHNVPAVKWYLKHGFVVLQPHENDALRKEIAELTKEIKRLQNLGQDCIAKQEELKYKKQQLKYLMVFGSRPIAGS
ncbi:MAG: GNAT family N-acetyltransferase [Planctomycetota bacterium]|jgi:GNAT superfamily N-acetyltransferase